MLKTTRISVFNTPIPPLLMFWYHLNKVGWVFSYAGYARIKKHPCPLFIEMIHVLLVYE